MSEISQEKSYNLSSIVENLQIGVIVLDKTFTVLYINSLALQFTLREKQDLLGKSLLDIYPHFEETPTYQKYYEAFQTRKKVTFETYYEKVNCWLEIQAQVQGDNLIITLHDISAKKNIEKEMEHLARHDPLTTLPNRTMLKEGFNEAMIQAREKNKMLAVLFVDLDRFKFINDTLGHVIGDELLKQIANRMRVIIRKEDIIARIGGDEFLILLHDINEINDAVKVAQNILTVLEPALRVDGNEIHITGSIGISFYPHDGKTTESLLKNADTAMYRAKQQGKNSYELYSPVLNEKALERLMLENNLQHALPQKELIVYYQPQIELATNKIVGVEALVRWKHKELGMISPGDFIPIAEETGLIIPISKWILQESCEQIKKWNNQGFSNLSVGVNFSVQSFKQKNWVSMILDVVKEVGIDPHSLDLEITENGLMQNTQQTIKSLDHLRSYGITFSIDDFGTGFSSLSYLNRFPIDTLKIDQSFMRYVTTDSDDAAIITAIVAMAHKLDIKVIAEGVESQEHVNFIRSIGCDIAQGYFFSLPLPAEEMTKLLQSNK
jgi:diguanylate cyclase (GGDEF)-like protein